MINVGNKEYIVIEFLIQIAKAGKHSPVTLQSFAESIGISLSYAEQLVTPLRDAGYVKGQRGPGGGFLLATDADRISVADIAMLYAPWRTTKGMVPTKAMKSFSKSLTESLDEYLLSELVS